MTVTNLILNAKNKNNMSLEKTLDQILKENDQKLDLKMQWLELQVSGITDSKTVEKIMEKLTLVTKVIPVK